MRTRSTVVGSVVLLSAAACGSTPPKASSPAPAQPPAQSSAVVSADSTRLSADGCSVEVPGKWSRFTPQEADPERPGQKNPWWDASRSDGDEELSMLVMPWKPQNQAGMADGLDAAINVRKDAERSGNAELAQSEIQFRTLTRGPTAFYTSRDSVDGGEMATMMLATPKAICVLLWTRPLGEAQDFAKLATAALETVVVDVQ